MSGSDVTPCDGEVPVAVTTVLSRLVAMAVIVVVPDPTAVARPVALIVAHSYCLRSR